MTAPVPAVQQLGAAVLLQGAALLDARRFVTLGIRAASRDGIAAPPRVALLLRALTTREVATMLGLSHRQTQRMARTLEARQLRSGVYVYDRTAVDAYLIERNHHHSRKATPA